MQCTFFIKQVVNSNKNQDLQLVKNSGKCDD